MKRVFSIIFLFSIVFSLNAQDNSNLISKLKGLTKKGDYIILELRLNKEDEFRTMDGSSSSLARIAIYTGNNQGTEIVTKGFEGMNSIVTTLNNLKQTGWRLIQVYPMKGESLIIIHYILERKK
ncbi:MAG: hypothetical protein COA97_10080 [Flavobacteriales bacterium]|nr:MAG: hypothetical protein COA97_10080 [Flavobacteriales bacterium]